MWRSAKRINRVNVDEDINDLFMKPRDAFKLCWTEFIPPVIVGGLTVAATIGANRVGTTRAAALAAAFRVSQELTEEYKDKVAEVLGKKQEQKLRDDLEGDRIQKTPGSEVIIISGANAIFFDTWSKRFFQSDMETVRKAVNEINATVNNSYYASLSDFYSLIGLEETEVSDEFGWNSDELMEITFHSALKDDKAVIAINYNKNPIRGYARVN